MQLDVEVSPPANAVWTCNLQTNKMNGSKISHFKYLRNVKKCKRQTDNGQKAMHMSPPCKLHRWVQKGGFQSKFELYLPASIYIVSFRFEFEPIRFGFRLVKNTEYSHVTVTSLQVLFYSTAIGGIFTALHTRECLIH